MRIYFLGTNGWYDTKTGDTTCVLVETGREYVIFDAGNGLYKIDKYILVKKPIYLFLSHLHLDHVIGLHVLDKFNFSQGIDVFGPKGTRQFFNNVINAPYSKPLNQLKTKVRVKELVSGMRLPLDIEFKKLLHASLCYGYRFLSNDKIITFCTDTGFCNNLIALSRNSNLLITECSLNPDQVNASWPHLNPRQAAEAANSSGAKMLALLHFDASIYLDIKQRKKAECYARRIFSNTFAAFDGLSINI